MQGSAGRKGDLIGEGGHGSDISLISQTIYNTRIYGMGVFLGSHANYFRAIMHCISTTRGFWDRLYVC